MALTRLGPALAVALAALAAPGPSLAVARQLLRGTVTGEPGGAPVAGARVRLLLAGTSGATDRTGRFELAHASLPDTLVVSAIGWVPDTSVVTESGAPVRVRLARPAAAVSDLIVTARAAPDLDLSEHGRWRLSLPAARAVPPAIETDVLRALALAPAVSFTSPLSARPMVRGYDAQEVTTRIDGFELPNLYHLGRAFSSYPADAAEQVTLLAAPYSASHGGSIAALVDLAGRSGTPGGLRGGASASFGSLAAHAGGGGPAARYFAAFRFFHLGALNLLPGVTLPYHFEDLYGSAALGPVDRPFGRLTLFATRDDVGDRERGLRWHNLLLGGRWRLRERGAGAIEAHAAVARYAQRGRAVPSLRRSAADVATDFARVGGGVEAVHTGPRWRVAGGVSAGWRRVDNRISESQPGGRPELPPHERRGRRGEGVAWLAVTRRLGPVAVEAGLRADAAGTLVSLQPRVRARWTASRAVALGLAAGRASRLWHVLADARSEPDVEYLDFWLDPGKETPVPRVDHLSADLVLELPPALIRASLFASRGAGLGELRPETDQHGGAEPFRFGRARTRGLEAQLAIRRGGLRPRLASLSYALSWSERHWGAGWVRWAQDRRHQARAFGSIEVAGVTLFGALDASTGMPLTPVVGYAGRLAPGGGGPADPASGTLAEIHGPEHAAGTTGTVRLDGGAAFSFGGGSRRFTLGLSVINLLGTAVAPIADGGEGTPAADQAGRPTRYRRLFDLPPIPTLTLRAELGPPHGR